MDVTTHEMVGREILQNCINKIIKDLPTRKTFVSKITQNDSQIIGYMFIIRIIEEMFTVSFKRDAVLHGLRIIDPLTKVGILQYSNKDGISSRFSLVATSECGAELN